MSDHTPNPVNSTPNFDDLPLPERIAKFYNFRLTYHDLDDGKRYYAVQDWIVGVTQTDNPRAFWNSMKKRTKKAGIDMSTWCLHLPYLAADGKRYKMDHADAETLYKITQRMDVNTGLRNDILNYLAKAGVVLDDMYRDPDSAEEVAAALQDSREYNKLIAEGFTPEEARQWLEQRAAGIETRKWITHVWRKRKAKGRDFAILTNQVSGMCMARRRLSANLRWGWQSVTRRETTTRQRISY